MQKHRFHAMVRATPTKIHITHFMMANTKFNSTKIKLFIDMHNSCNEKQYKHWQRLSSSLSHDLS